MEGRREGGAGGGEYGRVGIRGRGEKRGGGKMKIGLSHVSHRGMCGLRCSVHVPLNHGCAIISV
jgi:hypothetical protein